ncbi:9153_t:CDS:2 [Racocetra fulgida]|uniref:9153_t:CDS:1 n=1 Tax=Racocetra fulgida TaxID=60492 RepID=A0A9N8Z1V0_9GLOM|nr:9153_t:CDS:2 [Racocetra fulgida]
MWQGLFVDHGNGIRPLPVDCLLFFWTIASYLRGIHSLCMLTNAYTRNWQKETFQELGFTVLCYGAIDSKSDSTETPVRDIYLPRPVTLNYYLAIWLLLPTVTVFPSAVLSGIYRDLGNNEAADPYYGINFMLILRGSMKNFNRKSTNYHQTKNGAREALERLKYTMIYLAVLPLISAPVWGMYGIYRYKLISSMNLSNVLLSSIWHMAGPQPLIAICQYLLAKRVYLHFTGKLTSSQNESVGSQSNLTQNRPTLARSPTSNTFGDYATNDNSPNLSEDFVIDLKPIRNDFSDNNLLGADLAVSVPAPAYGSEHDLERRS